MDNQESAVSPTNQNPNNHDKNVPIMFYTQYALIWGNVVINEKVRVNMWLRTSIAPEIIHLSNCKMLVQNGNKQAPVSYKEIHLLSHDILAYHLLPPEKEPLDYDPQEPNRHFENVLAYSGFFKFEGNVLLSNLYSIGQYIESTHERFISFYDAEITYPFSSSQNILKIPQVLVRISNAVFATQ